MSDGFYYVLFVALLGAVTALKYSYSSSSTVSTSAPFNQLQTNYLVGFLAFKLSDWLQVRIRA